MEHIMDLKGYDHMLFLLALCAPYSYKDWKKVVGLITAFTIGHSITLALSVMNMIRIPSEWIEFIIPVTIVLTAFVNLISLKIINEKHHFIAYFTTLIFGFIHGLGFSYLLKSLLGREANILFPLFSFNLGIELGQIIIVSVILIFSILLNLIFHLQQRIWNLVLSSAALCIAMIMVIQRLPELL